MQAKQRLKSSEKQLLHEKRKLTRTEQVCFGLESAESERDPAIVAADSKSAKNGYKMLRRQFQEFVNVVGAFSEPRPALSGREENQGG